MFFLKENLVKIESISLKRINIINMRFTLQNINLETSFNSYRLFSRTDCVTAGLFTTNRTLSMGKIGLQFQFIFKIPFLSNED